VRKNFQLQNQKKIRAGLRKLPKKNATPKTFIEKYRRYIGLLLVR